MKEIRKVLEKLKPVLSDLEIDFLVTKIKKVFLVMIGQDKIIYNADESYSLRYEEYNQAKGEIRRKVEDE